MSAGLGITRGALATQQYMQAKPERDARLAEAQSRQQMAEMQLQEYQQGAPVRKSQQELQLQQLQNELLSAQQQGLRGITFSAFSAYDADGDVRHLNNFLNDAKRNPIGSRMYSDAVRYEPIGEQDKSALAKAGISDVDALIASPEAKKMFVAAIDSKGQRQVLDINKVYAASGYTEYMNQKQLADMEKRSMIMSRLQKGEKLQNLTAAERVAKAKAEAEGIPYYQAYEELTAKKAATAGSANERIALKMMEEDPSLNYIDAYEKAIQLGKTGSAMEREAKRVAEESGRGYQDVYAELKKESERTTSQKSVDEIEEAKQKLDETFGGSFLSADLSSVENRRKANQYVMRIEKDFPLSTEDRRTLTEVRQLSSLAQTAAENITDAEAGPIDSLVRNVKKYLTNDIQGVNGTAAYETFRNTLRHALYGASLTAGEISAFNAAAGSLTEQAAPALLKMKTQVEELKSKLEAVYSINDEYVAKYRLNMDMDQLAKAISSLDERVDMINGAMPTNGEDVKTITPETAKRKPLAEYFKQ